jgi:opacity protein-like surface antigen
MPLVRMVLAFALALFALRAQADCTTRCRPNLFFPERTDCYTDCIDKGSIVPFAGAASAPGKPAARFRLLAGMPLASGQVMDAGGNWAGLIPATLKSEARLQSGGFGCIQAAGSPRLLSLYIEMSGFSRPLVARGITLGTSNAWDLGVGLEVGHFLGDWIWVYGQIGGLMGTRDFTVSGHVPEQTDSLGAPAQLDGKNSGFGYKASLGLDVRLTASVFLNLSWHYKPSKETYPDGGIGSTRKGFDLNATTSVVAAGIAYHTD